MWGIKAITTKPASTASYCTKKCTFPEISTCLKFFYQNIIAKKLLLYRIFFFFRWLHWWVSIIYHICALAGFKLYSRMGCVCLAPQCIKTSNLNQARWILPSVIKKGACGMLAIVLFCGECGSRRIVEFLALGKSMEEVREVWGLGICLGYR